MPTQSSWQNDRRERLVKLSRDLTIGSKRLIFLLLRQGEPHKIKQAHEALIKLHLLIEKIASEVQGKDYWQYQRAFSAGLQEYIEAMSLFHYITTHHLITKTEIERHIQQDNSQGILFPISDEDYFLGIADLSGELMRLAIGTASGGNVAVAMDICEFLKALYNGYEALNTAGLYGMDAKIRVMESSVSKVETLCLGAKMQAGEALGRTAQ